MILQDFSGMSEGMTEQMLLIAIISVIVMALIMFIIGIFITILWASKKGWDKSFKTATIVNLVWLFIDLGLGLALSPLALGIIGNLVTLVFSIIIGAIVVIILYEKEFGESLIFVIMVLIIKLIVATIVGLIIGMTLVMVIIGSMGISY